MTFTPRLVRQLLNCSKRRWITWIERLPCTVGRKPADQNNPDFRPEFIIVNKYLWMGFR